MFQRPKAPQASPSHFLSYRKCCCHSALLGQEVNRKCVLGQQEAVSSRMPNIVLFFYSRGNWCLDNLSYRSQRVLVLNPHFVFFCVDWKMYLELQLVSETPFHGWLRMGCEMYWEWQWVCKTFLMSCWLHNLLSYSVMENTFPIKCSLTGNNSQKRKSPCMFDTGSLTGDLTSHRN